MVVERPSLGVGVCCLLRGEERFSGDLFVACSFAGGYAPIAAVLDAVFSENLGGARSAPGLGASCADIVGDEGFESSFLLCRTTPFGAVGDIESPALLFVFFKPSSPLALPSRRPADNLSASPYLPLPQDSIASRHLNRGLLRTKNVIEANNMPSPTRTIASKEVGRVLA